MNDTDVVRLAISKMESQRNERKFQAEQLAEALKGMVDWSNTIVPRDILKRANDALRMAETKGLL